MEERTNLKMTKPLGVKIRRMVMPTSEWGKLVCHNFLWANYKLVFLLISDFEYEN